jgi:hypothetical protein
MPKPSFELDPREANAFVRGMPARQELVYRLAIRGLCARCRGDRAFTRRTDELIAQFSKDLAVVITEANRLGEELMAAVAGR